MELQRQRESKQKDQWSCCLDLISIPVLMVANVLNPIDMGSFYCFVFCGWLNVSMQKEFLGLGGGGGNHKKKDGGKTSESQPASNVIGSGINSNSGNVTGSGNQNAGNGGDSNSPLDSNVNGSGNATHTQIDQNKTSTTDSVSSPIGIASSPSVSLAILVKSDTSCKSVNFRTLITPAGNGAYVFVSKESNTWSKFGVVKSMMIKDIFFFKFRSKVGMESMLENGLWLIDNVPLILKKWTPNVNIMTEDVCNIPVLVKFHDILIIVFIEDRESYARAMVKLQVDVELKDTIVVVVPKFFNTIRVEPVQSTKKTDKASAKSKVTKATNALTSTSNSFNALNTLVDEDDC
ncbi:zinc knuckle CX2CX4HX4C containing protein [Tanacetum coccineum]|uniref:Zinc knuckle CX2CX4HX4C containing protein n=1 Tax=Tanacetum coccineum TaxID=301880 RepID=A0ABQ5GMS0_9ASTR